MHRKLLVVGILLCQCLASPGDEKSAAKPDSAPPTEKELKALIDQLVSPNPQPILDDTRGDYDLPKGFDRQKQDAVRQARSKLIGHGVLAFPHLIEGGTDKRYSLTTCNGLSGAYFNESVGTVCRTILFDQLQPYGYWQDIKDDPRGKPYRPSYPDRFLDSQKEAKGWWEKNQQKSLYQLQLQALDWVIAEEAKRPDDFAKEEKQSLLQIREKLVKGGKPLPAGNYNANEVEPNRGNRLP